VAPFDGQVLYLSLAPGQQVAANEVVGVIADPNQLEVSAELSPNRLEPLVEGLTAEITDPGGRQRSFAGLVRQLPFPGAGAADGGDPVRVSFDNPGDTEGFELGERVTVQVLVENHTDVLWLPPAAVRDFNGRNFVVVEDGDFQRRTDITLGLVGEERVEIVTGLVEGEVVVGP
jgi:multidrug efflux pump subunit AcrA (membrane-fusion protein)